MAIKPTLHLAWTLDDGPTQYTAKMIENFPSENRPATWFIQYDNLLKHKTALAIYKKLQDKGHEIAIHGIHQSKKPFILVSIRFKTVLRQYRWCN